MARTTPGAEDRRRGSSREAIGALVLLFSMAACTKEQLGLPGTPVTAKSPDGRHIAFVRNHPSLDPPAQSLWLSTRGRASQRLRSLGEDRDWCRTIVWSADSSTVSYLVHDSRLITVDAEAGRIVSEKWLTGASGEILADRVVADLSLSDNGREARFRICRRNPARSGRDDPPADCGDLRTLATKN